MTNGKQYLRAADIARLAGVSVRTVRRWIADRILPSTKIGGTRLVAKAEFECLFSPRPRVTDEDTENDDK